MTARHHHLTPTEAAWLNTVRIERACELLCRGDFKTNMRTRALNRLLGARQSGVRFVAGEDVLLVQNLGLGTLRALLWAFGEDEADRVTTGEHHGVSDDARAAHELDVRTWVPDVT